MRLAHFALTVAPSVGYHFHRSGHVPISGDSMRFQKCLALTLLGCGLSASPSELLAQRPGGGERPGGGGFPGGGGGGFPGGGGGGGRPQMDPNAIWLQMSGGADSIDLNKNPGLKSMVTRGGNPLPPDGILTKAAFQTAMASRMSGRTPGGPGAYGAPAAPIPVPGSGVPLVVSVGSGNGGGDKPIIIGAPGSSAQIPPGAYPGSGGGYPGGGYPGSGGGFPGGGDRGGRGGGGMSLWGDPDSLFARADQNKDGKIVREETRMLTPYFEQIDTNKDGGIDLAELKVFSATMAAASGGGGGYPGAPGGGFPGGGDPKIEDPENERPVVFRFGKLPKDFPYASIDKDEDGQVSLYEWRTATKSVDEFVDRDLNGDGFLTAEEWLRGTKTSLGGADAKKDDKGRGQYPGGNMGGGGQFGGRPGMGGPSGGESDKKDKKREGGRN